MYSGVDEHATVDGVSRLWIFAIATATSVCFVDDDSAHLGRSATSFGTLLICRYIPVPS